MSATAPVAPPASESSNSNLVSLLIAVVLGTLLSVVVILGIVYVLLHSGRLKIPSIAAGKPLNASQATHTITLEPLLINLSDNGGDAYLRIGLTLLVYESAEKQETKTTRESDTKRDAGKDGAAAIRDTAIHVLGRQTASELLRVEGKERLKQELKAALAEHNPEIQVSDIYFTEFLVQR